MAKIFKKAKPFKKRTNHIDATIKSLMESSIIKWETVPYKNEVERYVLTRNPVLAPAAPDLLARPAGG